MKEQLALLQERFTAELANIADRAALEQFEQRFFSRKSGEFTQLMQGLKSIPDEERKDMGKRLNDVKNEWTALVAARQQILDEAAFRAVAETEAIDVTQPPLTPREAGHLHPNTLVENELVDFFMSMGFSLYPSPEMESEYYNFTAMNIPPDHPARDMQDTLYVKGHPGVLMRTHTSSFQVRAMKQYGAPLRIINPGRCFRNEATDPRHEHTFYQFDGVMIDRDMSLAHLKGILEAMARHLYGKDAKLRLRPKFYPFVEPGVNGEVTCFLCRGKGCRVCKETGWLEIFGAGMIHPHVLKAGGVDPAVYQGFAFGLGLTRLVMLKYGIEDIRLLQGGDLRFLQQF